MQPPKPIAAIIVVTKEYVRVSGRLNDAAAVEELGVGWTSDAVVVNGDAVVLVTIVRPAPRDHQQIGLPSDGAHIASIKRPIRRIRPHRKCRSHCHTGGINAHNASVAV